MIRKRKVFSRPKKSFELSRIQSENKLVEKYGLKSKREIWKAVTKITYYRTRAKALARESQEEQQILFNKLSALGLKVNTISDVLGLQVEDIFQRRLPTIVAKKKLAQTPQHARQMVVHKKILVAGKVVNVPSYIVPVALEGQITVRHKVRQPKAVKEEAPEASAEEASA